MTTERKAFIISCTVSGSFYGGIEYLAWQDRFRSTDNRGHCCHKPLQKKQILYGSPHSILAAECCYLLHSLPLHSVRWPQPRLDMHRGADKSLARPTSRCILSDGENISFDASLVIYINSTNIPPITIINRIYETQNLLSL